MGNQDLGGLTRRTFIKQLGVAGASVATGLNSYKRAEATANGYLRQDGTPDLELIARDMRTSVRHIFEGVNVTYVTPETYKREVFQEDMPPKKRKPVMMFAFSDIRPEKYPVGGPSPDTGIATVCKQIKLDLGDRIKLVAYDDQELPKTAGYTLSNLSHEIGVTTIPSVVIYSKFDLLRKETSESNDGKIKKIDIFKTGFSDPYKWWGEVYNFLGNEWLGTNVTQPNGKYVWRFNNSKDEKRFNIAAK